MKAAPAIVHRLRSGAATVSGLMKEYHTGYLTIMCAILSVMPEPEYKTIRHRLLSRSGVMTYHKPRHTTTVIKDAPKIAHRLRSGATTISDSMKEYHAAYKTIMRAVRSVMSEVEYKGIRHRLLSLGGVRTRLKPGHVTWNKGRKGVHNPGSEKGWFKKGHAAYSHAPGHKVRPNDDIRRTLRGRKKHNYIDGSEQALPKDVRDSLETLRRIESWWECVGCAQEFSGEPPYSCPKCGGLRFAIISQKKNAV